jgi:hypothetical protein
VTRESAPGARVPRGTTSECAGRAADPGCTPNFWFLCRKITFSILNSKKKVVSSVCPGQTYFVKVRAPPPARAIAEICARGRILSRPVRPQVSYPDRRFAMITTAAGAFEGGQDEW